MTATSACPVCEPIAPRRCDRCRAREHAISVLLGEHPPGEDAGRIIDVVCDRSPRLVRRWLGRHPDIVAVLAQAATGQITLTHHHLDDLADTAVHRLRPKLIAVGVLPDLDHQLHLFDQWIQRRLATIDDPAHRQQVAAFATWQHRRRLAAAIDNGTIRPASIRGARNQINTTIRFLDWLAARGRPLADCTQNDLDTWFARPVSTSIQAVAFITWARTHQLCRPDLRVPVYQAPTPAGMPHAERVDIIRHLLTDDTIPDADRIAGLLVALYAQPVSRVSNLQTDAITIEPDRTILRLGPDHLELAEPVAQLLRHYLVTIGETPWLFPGTTHGQPCSPQHLAARIRRHGVTREARVAALHDLTQHIPSPVLADLIAYNPRVIARRAAALGTPWDHYAAIRTRPPHDTRE